MSRNDPSLKPHFETLVHHNYDALTEMKEFLLKRFPNAMSNPSDDPELYNRLLVIDIMQREMREAEMQAQRNLRPRTRNPERLESLVEHVIQSKDAAPDLIAHAEQQTLAFKNALQQRSISQANFFATQQIRRLEEQRRKLSARLPERHCNNENSI